MGFPRLILFFAVLLILPAQRCGATHVVGGEIMYSHLGNNKYHIQLDLFIDCQFGNPSAIADDKIANLFVFGKNSGQLLPGYPMEVWRSKPQRLVKLHYNCLLTAPNACVDYYIYDTIMQLPPTEGGYIISFQRCCRNNSISNLLNPGAQGANYWTNVPDSMNVPDLKHNSSAYFKELPPNFLCTNAPLIFDHSATDADGDSLAYDLFHPYLGASNGKPRPDNNSGGAPDYPPFKNINWLPPYNENDPIDGSPKISIHPKSGLLTVTPTKIGQFVVGIRVREYRNDTLISETRRDYQFNVSECNLLLDPGPSATSVTCNNLVQFKNNSIGAVRYSWDFGVSNRTDDTSNSKTPVFTYPKVGIYQAVLKVYRANCEDSAVTTVRVGHKATGKMDVNVLNCSMSATASVAAESDGFEIWFDGKKVSGNPAKVPVSEGDHFFKAIFIDTFANCNDSVEQTINLENTETDIRLANVFTPGKDGFNDCFHIGGNLGDCFIGEMVVFNRWGERVWYTKNLFDCWNGNVNGGDVKLPNGTYFYQLTYGHKDIDERLKTVTGSITLIREAE